MYSLPQNISSFIFFFIKKHWKTFLIAQIFCFGMTLDHILWPQVVRMTIEALENFKGSRDQIWPAISHIVYLGLFAWLAIEISFRISGIILAAKLMPVFEAEIRMEMFKYVIAQTHSFFANYFAGSLANKTNDMPRASSSIVMMIMTLFIPALMTFIIMTSMFMLVSCVFGGLIMVWLVIHLGICFFHARKCQKYSDIHAESRSRLMGRIVDCFTNNVSLRLFSRREYEIGYINKFQEDEKHSQKYSHMYIEKVKIILGIFTFLFIGVFLTWLQIYSYQNGFISLADLIFIFQGALHVSSIAWWVGLELPRLFQEIGVCNQALNLVQTPIDIVDKPNAMPLKVTEGQIVFDNVTFNYEKNKNIFHNQSLTIYSGQKVGLVGFSGSGKTTFVNLILRYFDIESGSIFIDGQNIANVTQDSLREQIAMIPQEPLLFHRSLMENIRYGNIDATDEEVIEAARKAHCDEFISKMKNKYHTIAGERGLKLSGGQRQRIAIARAILKKARILIMDEATSALDSVTEQYIQDSITEMSKDRTTLIIAHRLSTLIGVDRILVFKEGSIVEDGNHEELMRLKGHYCHLWEMQLDGFLPETDGNEEGEWEEDEEV